MTITNLLINIGFGWTVLSLIVVGTFSVLCTRKKGKV